MPFLPVVMRSDIVLLASVFSPRTLGLWRRARADAKAPVSCFSLRVATRATSHRRNWPRVFSEINLLERRNLIYMLARMLILGSRYPFSVILLIFQSVWGRPVFVLFSSQRFTFVCLDETSGGTRVCVFPYFAIRVPGRFIIRRTGRLSGNSRALISLIMRRYRRRRNY